MSYLLRSLYGKVSGTITTHAYATNCTEEKGMDYEQCSRHIRDLYTVRTHQHTESINFERETLSEMAQV